VQQGTALQYKTTQCTRVVRYSTLLCSEYSVEVLQCTITQCGHTPRRLSNIGMHVLIDCSAKLRYGDVQLLLVLADGFVLTALYWNSGGVLAGSQSLVLHFEWLWPSHYFDSETSHSCITGVASRGEALAGLLRVNKTRNKIKTRSPHTDFNRA
jgi:hypothetical protein